jgi:hypothetical protein
MNAVKAPPVSFSSDEPPVRFGQFVGEPLFTLLLCLLPAGAPMAQEAAIKQPQAAQAPRVGQAAPDAPSASHQKPDEKHPRLFWVIPNYTVADSESVSPLTTRGKGRLFVKDATDPFNLFWVAFDAGIA